jgi:hypothetical protein
MDGFTAFTRPAIMGWVDSESVVSVPGGEVGDASVGLAIMRRAGRAFQPQTVTADGRRWMGTSPRRTRPSEGTTTDIVWSAIKLMFGIGTCHRAIINHAASGFGRFLGPLIAL